MTGPVSSITRAATRKPDKPLNILCAPTHEAYETSLAKTGHNFYAYQVPKVFKTWNSEYRPLPSNYHLLEPQNINLQHHQGPLPMPLVPVVDFDLVLSQNKFGQFQVLQMLARQLQLPLVSLEHTLPLPSWPQSQIEQLKNLAGNINVFVSEYGLDRWGWDKKDAQVIHHGIDTNLFAPVEAEKKPVILSVVNDWINRDIFCGYHFWREATQGLPVHPVGKTPGLSKPASSVAELVQLYQTHQIFVNTSLIASLPVSLLESMSCGAAVISTNTSMIPQVIKHGVNGMLAEDPSEMKRILTALLRDKDRCLELGRAARQTILERFSETSFIKNWQDVFQRAVEIRTW